MLAAPPGAVIALGDGASVGAGPGGGPGGAGGRRSGDRTAAGVEPGPDDDLSGAAGRRSDDRAAAGVEAAPDDGPADADGARSAGGERSADAAAAGTGDVAGATRAEPAEVVPLLAGRGLVTGAPAAYVCRNFTCRMPVTDPMELRAALAYPAPAPAG
jgi:hypothetical protein